MDGFWNEMARLGKDRNPYRAGFLQFVGVAETREKALELYREPAEYFYGRCLHTDPMWATPPGYVTEATQRAGMASQVGRAAATSARGPRSAPPKCRTSSISATSSSARPMRSWRSSPKWRLTLNVGHLMLLLQFGNMGKELAKYNTKLFAEAVMPRLQPLFAGMGGSLVAPADGPRRTRRGACVRSGSGRRIDSPPHTSRMAER